MAGANPTGNAWEQFRYGEVLGGTGGGEFDDTRLVGFSRIKRVNVRYAYYVDAVQVTIEEEGRDVELERHGGEGGIDGDFVLDPGEYITKVEVYYGEHYIHGLRLTSNVKTGNWFGRAEGDYFAIVPLEGFEIAGFWGRAGIFLDAIGGVFRSRAAAAPPAGGVGMGAMPPWGMAMYGHLYAMQGMPFEAGGDAGVMWPGMVPAAGPGDGAQVPGFGPPTGPPPNRAVVPVVDKTRRGGISLQDVLFTIMIGLFLAYAYPHVVRRWYHAIARFLSEFLPAFRRQ